MTLRLHLCNKHVKARRRFHRIQMMRSQQYDGPDLKAVEIERVGNAVTRARKEHGATSGIKEVMGGHYVEAVEFCRETLGAEQELRTD